MILARSSWDESEKGLIKDIASFIAVFKLGNLSRSKKPGVLWVCLLWVSLPAKGLCIPSALHSKVVGQLIEYPAFKPLLTILYLRSLCIL